MWTHILKNSLNFEIFNAGGNTGNPAHDLAEPHPSLFFYLLVLFRSGSDKFESCSWNVQPDFSWSQCWRGTPVRPSWRMGTLPSQAQIKWEGSPGFLRLLLILTSGTSLPARKAFSCLPSDFSKTEFVVFQRLYFICFLRESLFPSKPAPLFLSPLAG